jgi:hypothetical protein
MFYREKYAPIFEVFVNLRNVNKQCSGILHIPGTF